MRHISEVIREQYGPRCRCHECGDEFCERPDLRCPRCGAERRMIETLGEADDEPHPAPDDDGIPF